MRAEPTSEPTATETLPSTEGRWRFTRAGVQLTFANAAFAALTFVTAPILARALGPEGRGDLAAILVPLALAGPIALVGLDTFAARQAARGRPVGTLALSLGVVLAGIGTLVGLAGIPLSGLLAEGRSTVRTFLMIGFAMMPIVLVGFLLIGIGTGLERWRLVIAARLASAAIVLVGLVALFVVGSLTLTSAAIVHLASLLAILIVVAPVLRGGHRFRFDPGVVRKGIAFGGKAWVGTFADHANVRLDQLLMITLVSSRELGLYAVAANVGAFAWIITGGISPPLLARVSAGEVDLAPRALRMVLALVVMLTALVALLSPLLLSILFGSAFSDALEPALVLLAAGIPFAGTAILTQTLNGVGRPGLPAAGQILALAITVPGLLVLLGPLGALGAALVSLAAYSANFVFLLVATMAACKLSARELLVPTSADMVWLADLVRSRIGLWRRSGATPADVAKDS